MSSLIRNKWSSKCMLFIMMNTFLLCFVLYPITYTQNDNSSSKVGTSEALANASGPFHYLVYPSKITDFNDKETVNNLDLNQLILRSFQDAQRYAGKFNEGLALSLISLGMAVYVSSIKYKITSKHKSVISIFIGGHAPPAKLLFNISS